MKTKRKIATPRRMGVVKRPLKRPRPVPGLLTIEDLAARWQTTIERVLRRIREAPIGAINLGTVKNPELRFRLSTVVEWESTAERPARTLLGGKDGKSETTQAETLHPGGMGKRRDGNKGKRGTIDPYDPFADC